MIGSAKIVYLEKKTVFDLIDQLITSFSFINISPSNLKPKLQHFDVGKMYTITYSVGMTHTHTHQHTNESNLRTFISLNLAIAYLKSSEDRQSELSALMQSLDTDNVSCQSIKAATNYVQGLYMFTQLKLRDAKYVILSQYHFVML